MLRRYSLLVGIMSLLVGCSQVEQAQNAKAIELPVRVIAPQAATEQQTTLSGIVRAQTEMPLAFEVGGRIAQRTQNAGAVLQQGQPIMRLQTYEFEQRLQAAQAELAAADAAVSNARAELRRVEELIAAELASQQQRDQLRLQLTQAERQRDAAQANVALAQEALDDTQLVAPANGVLLEFSAEQDQVVTAGQAVAMFAYAGATEVEVLLPPTALAEPAAYQTAELLLEEQRLPLRLRETAGALAASGKTLRARYQASQSLALPLGSIVKVALKQSAQATWVVPLSAVDMRCSSADKSVCSESQVWRFAQGKAQPVPVQISRVDGEYAYITAALNADDEIIAAGTHQLTNGVAVRKAQR
jgi:RND family efflux transporter MFP subunit